MSTDYITTEKVRWSDLMDGRLESYGVREEIVRKRVAERTTDDHKILTDGDNFLHVYLNDRGFISSMTRFGGNDPGRILEAIEGACGTDTFDEYDLGSETNVVEFERKRIPWSDLLNGRLERHGVRAYEKGDDYEERLEDDDGNILFPTRDEDGFVTELGGDPVDDPSAMIEAIRTEYGAAAVRRVVRSRLGSIVNDLA